MWRLCCVLCFLRPLTLLSDWPGQLEISLCHGKEGIRHEGRSLHGSQCSREAVELTGEERENLFQHGDSPTARRW